MRTLLSVRSLVRLVAVVAIGIGMTSVSQTANATTAYNFCSDFSNMIWQYHRFGSGGACFQGQPNSVHTDDQADWCSNYHYSCS